MAVTINGTTGILAPDIGIDGTTLTVDAVNDRVGISTSSPNAKLQIVTDSGARALTVTAPTLGPYIVFETNTTPFADIGSEAGLVGSGSNTDMLTLNARGSRSLSFRTNSTERLRITSAGLIGIGATNNTSYDTNAQNLLLASSGNTGMTIRSAGSTPFAMIHFADGTTDNSQKRAGRIMYQHDGDNLTFHTANEERLRLSGDGDVGIGDAAPNNNYGTNLSVHSTATDGARLKLSDGTTGKGNLDGLDIISTGGVAYFINRENADMSFSNQGGERLRITSDGTVLMGGQTSSYDGAFVNLELRKDSTTVGGSMTLVNHQSATAGATCQIDCYQNYRAAGKIVFGRENANNWQSSAAGADSFLAFHTNDSGTEAERLRITSGGNVSITNTPTTNSSKLFIRANSGTDAGKWSHSCLAFYNTTLLGEYSQMGLGYTLGTWAPSYFGFVSTSQASWGNGALVFGTRSVTTDSQPTERLRITSSGTFVHTGGHDANGGGANLAPGAFNRINAGVSIPINSTKTLTITGLQTGWMTIKIGGYGSAGHQAINCMYELGGYMTATYTYDVHTVRQWARFGSITTTKNGSNFQITLPNTSTSYSCWAWITIEGNGGNLAVTSN